MVFSAGASVAAAKDRPLLSTFQKEPGSVDKMGGVRCFSRNAKNNVLRLHGADTHCNSCSLVVCKREVRGFEHGERSPTPLPALERASAYETFGRRTGPDGPFLELACFLASHLDIISYHIRSRHSICNVSLRGLVTAHRKVHHIMILTY